MTIPTSELFRTFWDHHNEWSTKTFGNRGVRGPKGPLKHLLEEVRQLLERPTDISEYADVLMLACDAARRAGIAHDALMRACFEKLEINRRRQWDLNSGRDEPVHHKGWAGQEPGLDAGCPACDNKAA